MPPTSLSVSYGIELDTLGEELQTAGKLIFRKNTYKIFQKDPFKGILISKFQNFFDFCFQP
jgi:hypothetical protein